MMTVLPLSSLHTHPVFLSALSRDVTKLLYFDLTTLPRLSARCLTHPLTIVHLPISVTKWVWMASLTNPYLIRIFGEYLHVSQYIAFSVFYRILLLLNIGLCSSYKYYYIFLKINQFIWKLQTFPLFPFTKEPTIAAFLLNNVKFRI